MSCKSNVVHRHLIVFCRFLVRWSVIDYCNAVCRRRCRCHWWTPRRWRASLIRCWAQCRGAVIWTLPPPLPASRRIIRRRCSIQPRRPIFFITDPTSSRIPIRSLCLRNSRHLIPSLAAAARRTTEDRPAHRVLRRRQPTDRRHCRPVQAPPATSPTWRRHLITTTIINTSSCSSLRRSVSSAATKVRASTTACWRAKAARASSSDRCVVTSPTRVEVVATAQSTNTIATSVNTAASRNASSSAWDEKVSKDSCERCLRTLYNSSWSTSQRATCSVANPTQEESCAIAQNTARSEGSVSKWLVAKVQLKFKSSLKGIWRSDGWSTVTNPLFRTVSEI